MSKFLKMRGYSRAEIHAQLGGSVRSFLPTVRGVVVVGCFRRDLNPDAPAVVLPDSGPTTKHSAASLAASGHPIPIFLYGDTKDWRFVGHYRVERLSTDPDEIKTRATRALRTDVSCVLHMVAAD
jgi:hypothetical protein